MSTEEFSKGERVKYRPTGAGNVSEGEVKRVITEPEAVGGRQTVRASEEDPRVVLLDLAGLCSLHYMWDR